MSEGQGAPAAGGGRGIVTLQDSATVVLVFGVIVGVGGAVYVVATGGGVVLVKGSAALMFALLAAGSLLNLVAQLQEGRDPAVRTEWGGLGGGLGGWSVSPALVHLLLGLVFGGLSWSTIPGPADVEADIRLQELREEQQKAKERKNEGSEPVVDGSGVDPAAAAAEGVAAPPTPGATTGTALEPAVGDGGVTQ
jgi:hypothetical protein